MAVLIEHSVTETMEFLCDNASSADDLSKRLEKAGWEFDRNRRETIAPFRVIIKFKRERWTGASESTGGRFV